VLSGCEDGVDTRLKGGSKGVVSTDEVSQLRSGLPKLELFESGLHLLKRTSVVLPMDLDGDAKLITGCRDGGSLELGQKDPCRG
jgi:hypothetical protein